MNPTVITPYFEVPVPGVDSLFFQGSIPQPPHSAIWASQEEMLIRWPYLGDSNTCLGAGLTFFPLVSSTDFSFKKRKEKKKKLR